MAVGRISGPLLKQNLIRNGIDLRFENDLLYLDVNNNRVGIKNGFDGVTGDPNLPTHELQITGTTRTTDLIVDNCAYIGGIKICNDTIEVVDGQYLNLGTLDNVVYQNKLTIDSIDMDGNTISTNESNANLELRANGTGVVNIQTDLNVSGNIHATGNISADGNITLGDADTDNVVFNAEVASDIIPDITNTYSLGSDPDLGGKEWNDVWVKNLVASSISSEALAVDGIDLTLRQGNIIFVAENGDDTNTGTHFQDPVASIEQALSIATPNDTVHIFPGTYTESFPLTVPQGVTVKGHSIRGVKVIPTTATRYNDAFLLNGETTIEDLTVADFYSGGNFFTVDIIGTNVTLYGSGPGTPAHPTKSPTTFDNFIIINVGTTGFDHFYENGGTFTYGATTITVEGAVYNETTGLVTLAWNGSPATGLNTSDTVFVEGTEWSCNGGTRVFPDNGYAFRFATDLEVTSRSPYIKNISVITSGSTTTADDPRGFLAGDAGKGAYIDGAYATANSKEAAMLFHSATFICPGVDAIVATNGARIEWLNSFTYFANRSIYAYDSNDGLYGNGKTRIRLSGLSGVAPAAGQTVIFTSTDSSTVVGPLSIESVDGTDTLIIDGKNTDLLGFDTTPASIAFSGTGTATTIENVDIRDFGAEIRLIGSASVYGNYGLYGDGEGVLMYAIGHNLAYIGNGKEVTNEPQSVIQANEVVELNGAQIRYNSVDHKGDFRVGDLFYVNQETGSATFSVSDFVINTTDGVTFNTGGQTTFVDGTKIETGDWRISGNTIETLSLDANFTAASNEINLNSNVNVDGNLDVTGNVTIGGNITIGDEASDTIQFVAGIDSDIIPSQTSTYSLGTESLRWSNLYVNQVNVDDIEIRDNYITTTLSNSDLELRANGTGEILVPSNDAQINNDLTVGGLATLANTNITGTVTLIGDFNQTGNVDVTGDVDVTQNLDVGAAAQFEEILVDDNFITTTTSNADLELRANGTGEVLIPNNDVQINNDLTVNGTTTTVNITSTGLITADSFTTGDILIDNNVIETTQINSDLELRANGTGEILIPSNDVQIDNDLTVLGSTSLQGTSVTGTITHVGDTSQTGNYTIAGAFTNGDIQIDGNVIETTLSNSNLELRANGSGRITVPNNDVIITNNLTINGLTFLSDTSISGTLTHVGDTNQTGNYTITGQFSNDDILINGNTIETTDTNSDLELRASGTGIITVPNNDVTFSQALTVSGDTDLQDTTVTGTITHVGDTTQTGNFNLTGNFDIDGAVTITSTTQFEDIKIENNVITTTISNSDLELRASGTGTIIILSNDVEIVQDLDIVGTLTVNNVTSTGTITANRFSTGDILIDDNFITTTTSNSNLELRANGTGEILVPTNNVQIDNDLTVNGTTNLADTNVTGTITHVGDITQTGNFDVTGDINITGTIDVSSTAQFENIQIDNNFITTTDSNSDLELRAAGTGNISIPNNDVVISNALTVNGTLTVGDVVSVGTIEANNFTTGDILIDDNFITTTTSNSDLELRANGTGSIVIDTFNINGSTISSSSDITITPGTGKLIIDSSGALKLPVGDTSERPGTPVAGQIRYNSELVRFEGYNGTNWINLKGVQDLDGNTKITAELTEGANDNTIRFYVDGNVVADINSTRLNVEKIIVDDITIDGNVISTSGTNTDLQLSAQGTGSVIFENFAFDNNTITNLQSNAVTVFENTDDGYVKFDGSYGLVIPVGTNINRPPLAYTEVGQMRFNTDASRVEVWDGTNWVSVAGSQSGISRAEAEDIAFEIVLSLG